jgi:hypothetical protein
MIALGYIAGRFLQVKKESISPLLIYIITPFVVFNGTVKVTLSASALSLPVFFYTLCCLMSVVFYYIGKCYWKGTEKNILAFAAGTGNTGYFGVPVALALFSDDVIGIAVLSLLGFVLYTSTVGYFILSKGKASTSESIKNVFKLPFIYAFVAGIIVNLVSTDLGELYNTTAQSFQGVHIAYWE